MKYLYIAGLEHSGTTLLNQLLGADDVAVPVGEIFQFLSPDFMAGYLERWGAYEDAFQCACGRQWSQCPFWGKIPEAIDYSNGLSTLQRFQLFIDHVRHHYGDNAVIVDSSKSMPALYFLRENLSQLGLKRQDLLVVAAMRDVRGFVTSQLAKDAASGRSPRRVLALMRLWLHESRALLDYLEQHGMAHAISLYEQTCQDGGAGIAARVHAHGFPRLEPSLRGGDSHIALGNKNFLHRNRDQIRYDDRWRQQRMVKAVYQLYPPVRRFNRRLYKLV